MLNTELKYANVNHMANLFLFGFFAFCFFSMTTLLQLGVCHLLGQEASFVGSLNRDPSLIWNTVGTYLLIQSVTLFKPAGHFNFYWNLCLQNYDIQQQTKVLTIDDADTESNVWLAVKRVTFHSVEWCTSNQTKCSRDD